MKLYELVYLRNQLQNAIDLSEIKKALELNCSSLTNTFYSINCKDDYKDKILQLSYEHLDKFNVFTDDERKIKVLIDEINSEIFQLTRRFFEDNYQKECFYFNPDRLRELKKLVLADGSLQPLLSRINIYTTWQYPTLEIGCRDGEFTRYLVAADPLYITDVHDDFLQSAIEQFTPQYRSRIRKYSMTTEFIVNGLPKTQFGFIFSHNFFNYLSLDTIRQLLIQAKEWLKPGGVMLFTYNNADLSASAGMCENHVMTYVPKSMLVPMIESMGFEIIDAQDHLPSTSWIEIKKPGILRTVKAHQAMGEIKWFNI